MIPTPTPTTFAQLVDLFLRFINYLVPLLFAVVFVYVIWKLIDAWVINAGDEKKQAEGRTLALVAVIVFVLMLSTWGIVTLVRNSLFGTP
jgi:hypothetical protein